MLLPTGKVMFWQSWNASVGLWDPVTQQFSGRCNSRRAITTFSARDTRGWRTAACLSPAGMWTTPSAPIAPTSTIHSRTSGPTSIPPSPMFPTWVPITSTTSWQRASGGIPAPPRSATATCWCCPATLDPLTTMEDTNRNTQIYHAATNTWETLPGALRPANDLLPEYPRVFLAPDGRAISLSDNQDDTEYLDMSGTGQWQFVDKTLDDNLANYGPAVMYDVGKIAYMGGGYSPTANISVLDLNEPNPQWRFAAEPMAAPRRQNNATILADGSVLITGGTSTTDWNNPGGRVRIPEIWDPATEEVTQVAQASDIFRGYHSTALLLPDGRVLSAGGNHDDPTFTENKNAEIYSPPYLFKGARPTVTAAPEVVELGDTIFVATPDGADIAKALMVIPGAVTHAQNWTQRINYLDVAETTGGVNLTLPENPNHAPPGYYMLFLVNSNGVPSIAEWMKAELPTVQPDYADFNGDLSVDGADLLIWQQNLGGPAGAALSNGDANEDGVVDADDLAVWRAQFGTTLSPPSATIPEPSTLAMCGVRNCRVGPPAQAVSPGGY